MEYKNLLLASTVSIVLTACGTEQSLLDRVQTSIQLTSRSSIELEKAKTDFVSSINELVTAINSKKMPDELLEVYSKTELALFAYLKSVTAKYAALDQFTSDEDIKKLSPEALILNQKKVIQRFIEKRSFYNIEWKKAIKRLEAYKDLTDIITPNGKQSELHDAHRITRMAIKDLWGDSNHIDILETLGEAFQPAIGPFHEFNEYSDICYKLTYAYLIKDAPNSTTHTVSHEAKNLLKNLWDRLKSIGFSGYTFAEDVTYRKQIIRSVAREKGENPTHAEQAYPNFSNLVIDNLLSIPATILARADAVRNYQYITSINARHPAMWIDAALEPDTNQEYIKPFLESLVGLKFGDRYVLRVVDKPYSHKSTYVLSRTYRDIIPRGRVEGGAIPMGVSPESVPKSSTFYTPEPPEIHPTDIVITDSQLQEWSKVFLDALKADPFFKHFFEDTALPADSSSGLTLHAGRTGRLGLDAAAFSVNGISGSKIELGLPVYVQLKGSIDAGKSTDLTTGTVAYKIGNTLLGAIHTHANTGVGFGENGRQTETSVVASHNFGSFFVEGQLGHVSANDVNFKDWSGVRSQLTLGYDFDWGAPFVQAVHRDFGKTTDTAAYAGVEVNMSEIKGDTYTFTTNGVFKLGYHSDNDLVGMLEVRGSLNLNNGISFSSNLTVGTLAEANAGLSISLSQ
ncbi:MAG: hypothetical protein H6492_00640 [Candidatus Paracaedibacteraceae bacterium]|nr:hypothetical protein [Candidatus Paracaedibacteraceae bacterium]